MGQVDLKRRKNEDLPNLHLRELTGKRIEQILPPRQVPTVVDPNIEPCAQINQREPKRAFLRQSELTLRLIRPRHRIRKARPHPQTQVIYRNHHPVRRSQDFLGATSGFPGPPGGRS